MENSHDYRAFEDTLLPHRILEDIKAEGLLSLNVRSAYGRRCVSLLTITTNR